MFRLARPSFVAVRFIYRQLGDDALGIVFFALQ
jgi:hypothetical protein